MDLEKPKVPLKQRWEALSKKGNRASILERCEKYASWTLPHLFPKEGDNTSTEMAYGHDSLGARAVNHLANKVATTMFGFGTGAAFFRLRAPQAAVKLVKEQAGPENKEEAAQALAEIDAALAEAEKTGMEYLDSVTYRPLAVLASSYAIVTGNALMYHPEGKPAQTYSLRNYCIVRDISGKWIELMTLETKAFSTFPNAVRDQLELLAPKQYEDDTPVNIYTKVVWEEDMKYHVYQAADEVDISKPDMAWPEETVPWIPLAWKLLPGEDYGRGQVEDYAGAFSGLEVLTESLISIAGIMGDIKFLVNPASMIDVHTLNNSPAGSYHSGKPEDIGTPVLNKFNEANFIQAMAERYEKQISQGFLLASGVTRDAERVTAEEIRYMAQELDTSNGGVYSRMANMWQLPTARIVLDQTKFPYKQWGVKINIVTGMDSLSRQGELDNLRLFSGDLTLLEAVPEDIRGGINPLKFMSYVGKQRSVDYDQFLYTPAELQQNQQQAMQQQAQLEQQKAAAGVAQAAGTAAVEQENT